MATFFGDALNLMKGESAFSRIKSAMDERQAAIDSGNDEARAKATAKAANGMTDVIGAAGGDIAGIINNSLQLVRGKDDTMFRNQLADQVQTRNISYGNYDDLNNGMQRAPVTFKTQTSDLGPSGKEIGKSVASSMLQGAKLGGKVAGPWGAAIAAVGAGIATGASGAFGVQAAKQKARLFNYESGYQNKLNREYFNNQADQIRNNTYGNLYANRAAKGGQIHIKKSNEGKFTEAAKRNHMTVQQFARKVLAKKNADKYSATMRKRANFARNAAGWRHAFGGNIMASGGEFNTGYMDTFNTHGAYFAPDMKYIDNGDTHEANPNGGVQIGVDPQGVPNLVEQGETIYDDYVFSDRLKLPRKYLSNEGLLERYAGKTPAYISKQLSKEAEMRPNDPVSNNGLGVMLDRLRAAQEQYKQDLEAQKMKRQLAKMSPEELIQLGAQIGQMQSMQQGQQMSPDQMAMMQQAAPEAEVDSENPEQQDAADQYAQMRVMQDYGLPMMAAYGGYIDERGRFTPASNPFAYGGYARLYGDGTPGEVVQVGTQGQTQGQTQATPAQGQQLYAMDYDGYDAEGNPNLIGTIKPAVITAHGLYRTPEEKAYMERLGKMKDQLAREFITTAAQLGQFGNPVLAALSSALLAANAAHEGNTGQALLEVALGAMPWWMKPIQKGAKAVIKASEPYIKNVIKASPELVKKGILILDKAGNYVINKVDDFNRYLNDSLGMYGTAPEVEVAGTGMRIPANGMDEGRGFRIMNVADNVADDAANTATDAAKIANAADDAARAAEVAQGVEARAANVTRGKKAYDTRVFNSAMKDGSPESLQDYLDKFPDGAHRTEVQAKLDELKNTTTLGSNAYNAAEAAADAKIPLSGKELEEFRNVKLPKEKGFIETKLNLNGNVFDKLKPIGNFIKEEVWPKQAVNILRTSSEATKKAVIEAKATKQNAFNAYKSARSTAEESVNQLRKAAENYRLGDEDMITQLAAKKDSDIARMDALNKEYLDTYLGPAKARFNKDKPLAALKLGLSVPGLAAIGGAYGLGKRIFDKPIKEKQLYKKSNKHTSNDASAYAYGGDLYANYFDGKSNGTSQMNTYNVREPKRMPISDWFAPKNIKNIFYKTEPLQYYGKYGPYFGSDLVNQISNVIQKKNTSNPEETIGLSPLLYGVIDASLLKQFTTTSTAPQAVSKSNTNKDKATVKQQIEPATFTAQTPNPTLSTFSAQPVTTTAANPTVSTAPTQPVATATSNPSATTEENPTASKTNEKKKSSVDISVPLPKLDPLTPAGYDEWRNGKSDASDEQKADVLPTWGRNAPIFENAISALETALTPLDKSLANAYLREANNIPNDEIKTEYTAIDPRYTPVDNRGAMNQLLASMNATRRSLANSGNPALQSALLSANYALSNGIGTSAQASRAQNDANYNQAVQMINANRQEYANRLLTAQEQNAARRLQRAQLVASLRSNAAQALENEKTARAQAISANRAKLADNLAKKHGENFAMNQVNSNRAFEGYTTDGTGYTGYNPLGSFADALEKLVNASKGTSGTDSSKTAKAYGGYIRPSTIYADYYDFLNGFRKPR